MVRYEFHPAEDPPEIVMAERLDQIAYELRRIADSMEDSQDG